MFKHADLKRSRFQKLSKHLKTCCGRSSVYKNKGESKFKLI